MTCAPPELLHRSSFLVPFSFPIPLPMYPVEFDSESLIELGFDSGENWWAAYLVGGSGMLFEEIVDSPSFDLVSWVKRYLVAYPVTAFPDDVTCLGSCLAACPATASPITCWDCLACLRKHRVACRVTAVLATYWGLASLLANPIAFLCSFQVGGR